MAAIQGKPHKGASNSKYGDSHNDLDFATIQPIGPNKSALDVVPSAAFTVGLTDRVAEVGSDENTIVLTGHDIRPGDIIRLKSVASNPIQVDMGVKSITDANTVELVGSLTDINGAAAPLAAADTFDILRPISIKSTSTGAMVAAMTFIRNGADQTVTEDTATPANNRPLPVKLTGTSGDVIINAANLNLEVQFQHDTANFDSARIGDGTLLATIKAGAVVPTNVAADTSIRVSDFYVYDTLLTIDTVLDAIKVDTGLSATEVTLGLMSAKLPATLGSKADAASLAVTQSTEDKAMLLRAVTALEILDNAIVGNEMQVDIISSALPAGGSTEAKQDTIITALGLQSTAAHQVTAQSSLTAIAASLALLDDTVSGNELQVDIVSSALPTGAATSANQDTLIAGLITDVTEFARLDFSVSNVTGAAYTELITSTASAIYEITIFVASGDPMYLSTGAAASEIDRIMIPPGGFPHPIKLELPINTRLSLKRVLAGTTSAGSIIVNLIG